MVFPAGAGRPVSCPILPLAPPLGDSWTTRGLAAGSLLIVRISSFTLSLRGPLKGQAKFAAPAAFLVKVKQTLKIGSPGRLAQA